MVRCGAVQRQRPAPAGHSTAARQSSQPSCAGRTGVGPACTCHPAARRTCPYWLCTLQLAGHAAVMGCPQSDTHAERTVGAGHTPARSTVSNPYHLGSSRPAKGDPCTTSCRGRMPAPVAPSCPKACNVRDTEAFRGCAPCVCAGTSASTTAPVPASAPPRRRASSTLWGRTSTAVIRSRRRLLLRQALWRSVGAALPLSSTGADLAACCSLTHAVTCQRRQKSTLAKLPCGQARVRAYVVCPQLPAT